MHPFAAATSAPTNPRWYAFGICATAEEILCSEVHRAARQHLYEWCVGRRKELELCIQHEKEEAERQERARVLKLEQERRDRLFATVAAWRQASELRAFVQAVRAKYPSSPHQADSNRVDRWALWPLTEADRIDPLLCTSDFFDAVHESR